MKILNIMLLAIVMMILSACGGGGATPTAVTQTYTGLYAGGEEAGNDAGVASVVGTGDNAVYTYNYQGTLINVTLPEIKQDGYIQDDIAGGSISFYIGGTTYSYSRFGAVASRYISDLDIIYTNPEVFYAGQKTSSMPTTGTAKYTGGITTFEDKFFSNAPIELNVDYGATTISGTTLAGTVMTFDEGRIIGSDFSGIMSSGPENAGSYHGSFFGPNAEELGGAGTFNDGDETFGFSFGAEK